MNVLRIVIPRIRTKIAARSVGSISSFRHKALIKSKLREVDSVGLLEGLKAIQVEGKPRLLGKIINVVLDMFVSANYIEVKDACDVLDCLKEVMPAAPVVGYLELLESCIYHKHVDAAIYTFRRSLASNVLADVSSSRSFIMLLVKHGRIAELVEVLDSLTYIDPVVMVVVAEPLLMSGKTEEYSVYLSKFLAQDTIEVRASEEHSLVVSDVLNSIVYSRIRRSMSQSQMFPEEISGIQNIFNLIAEHHNAIMTYFPDTSYLPSYCAAKRLYNVEMSLLETISAGDFDVQNITLVKNDSNVALRDMTLSEQSRSIQHLISLEKATSFPFLLEEKLCPLEDYLVNDLTAKLRPCHTTGNVLFSASLWPEDYEEEMYEFRSAAKRYLVPNALRHVNVNISGGMEQDENELYAKEGIENDSDELYEYDDEDDNELEGDDEDEDLDAVLDDLEDEMDAEEDADSDNCVPGTVAYEMSKLGCDSSQQPLPAAAVGMHDISFASLYLNMQSSIRRDGVVDSKEMLNRLSSLTKPPVPVPDDE